MPSTQGRLILAGSVLLAAAGRIFGSDELLAVGIAGVVVVVLSVAHVRVRRGVSLTDRSLEPSPIHVGDECRARLRIVNTGRFPTPVLNLTDHATVSTEASTTSFDTPEMLVAPVPARDELEVAYQIPTGRRGRVTVGPLTLTLTDPLGVSVRPLRFEALSEALIHPAVHPVEPPPRRLGSNFDAVRRSPLNQSGDELYGMRPFQQGDDPRRIHWPLSAHHDELIVRQFEEFSPTHTTLLLDTRIDPTGTETTRDRFEATMSAATRDRFEATMSAAARDRLGATMSAAAKDRLGATMSAAAKDRLGATMSAAARDRFEAMVSAAASICRAGQRRGDRIRLTTSAGFDSGYGSGSAHLDRIYEHLAVVDPQPGSLFEAIDRLCGERDGGLVVVVAAALDGTETDLMNRMGSPFGSTTVVLFAGTESAQPGTPPAAAAPAQPGTPPAAAAPAQPGTPPAAAAPGPGLVWVAKPQEFVGAWAEYAASRTGVATPTDPAIAADRR